MLEKFKIPHQSYKSQKPTIHHKSLSDRCEAHRNQAQPASRRNHFLRSVSTAVQVKTSSLMVASDKNQQSGPSEHIKPGNSIK
jgi:hypothetical protein